MDARSQSPRRAWVTGLIAVLWIGATIGLAGALFVASFLAAMKGSLRSSAVDVPDLSGRSTDEARIEARGRGLEVEVASERYDAEVPSGRVVEQDPPPGFEVRRGRTVKLTLSLGGEVLRIPRIIGRGDREVLLELRRAGFTPGDVTSVRHRAAPEGRVLAQSPPADSPALPGARVHRLVSSGSARPSWVMPDLVGLAREDAERWLRWSGLRAGPLREVPAEGRPYDTVVGQLPLSGYPVRGSDLVELSVAR